LFLKTINKWLGLVFFTIIWLLGFYWHYNTPLETAVLWFVPHRTENLNTFFLFATTLGEYYPYIAIFLLFLIAKKHENAVLVVFIGLSSMLISNVLKEYFQHGRPELFLEYNGGRQAELGKIPGHIFLSGPGSFPSGHTLSAFALYTLLAYMLPNRWQIPLLTVALAVGISRMYLGQHFLEDVLAGALIGVVWASIVHFSARIVAQRAQNSCSHETL
jgi:membrane-associated phospholipid phosphatase